MSFAFECEMWRRYLANDVDYFKLSTLKEQNEVNHPLQDADSAVSVVSLVRLRMYSSWCFYPKQMKIGN